MPEAELGTVTPGHRRHHRGRARRSRVPRHGRPHRAGGRSRRRAPPRRGSGSPTPTGCSAPTCIGQARIPARRPAVVRPPCRAPPSSGPNPSRSPSSASGPRVREPGGSGWCRSLGCGDLVDLASGIEPGEEVVTDGSFLLKTETLKDSIGAGCCDVETR